MSEMTFDEFKLPSQLPAPSLGGYPSWAQLKGRLVHILPTGRQDNVTSPKQPTPHTRLTADVTFLSGEPIGSVLDQYGNASAQLTPPIQPGQVMTEMFISQSWFVRRLKDKVGVPGFPGIIGVVGQENVKGNMMWVLTDPTPDQVATITQWFRWKVAQPAGSCNYVSAAPVAAPPVAPPAYAQPAAAAVAPPAGSPFAQPAAAPAGVPAGPWQPQLPPGMTPAAPATPVAPTAPAPQPGPDVPPWKR